MTLPRYLTCWFILTLSRSGLKVKLIGQSSRLQVETETRSTALACAVHSLHTVNLYTPSALWRMRLNYDGNVLWLNVSSGRCDLEWGPLLYYYFVPRYRGAKYCNQRVCVSVCVSSRVAETTRPNFTKFSLHGNFSRGSIFHWRRCRT